MVDLEFGNEFFRGRRTTEPGKNARSKAITNSKRNPYLAKAGIDPRLMEGEHSHHKAVLGANDVGLIPISQHYNCQF